MLAFARPRAAAAAAASRPGPSDDLAPSAVLWLAIQLARLHQLPFAPAALAERLQGATPWATVTGWLAELHIATRQGAKADVSMLARGDVIGLHDGAVRALLGEAVASSDKPLQCVAVVIAADSDRVLLVHPDARTPLARSRRELAPALEKIHLHSEASVPASADPDAADAAGQRFGWRWFAHALLQHRRLWRDVVLASLAIQLLALAVPLATQAVVDKVIVHRTQSTLVALGVGLVIVLVFSSLLSWLRQYLVLHTGNRVDAVLASTVFARLVRLPLRFFEHRPTGVLTARLQGVEQVREFVAGAAVTLVLDLPLVIVFVAIMAWYSLPLTALVLGVLALIAGLSIAVVPAFRRRLDAQFLAGARVQAFTTEHLAGIETIKTVQMEPPVQHRYEELLAQQLQATLATRQLGNGYGVAAGALEQAMTLAILFVGAWLAMTTRDFTIGMLVAFQMFASRLSQPVMRAVGLWQQFQQTRVAVRRLADIMDLAPEPASLAPARESPERPAIRVEQLGFRHGDGRPWLFRGLDLEIPFGSRIALMGASGCGKSTLAKLLLGLYAPGEGRILLAGVDIAMQPVNELRRHFGVVPQDTVLFSGSVYDNLTLGAPNARFEQVVAACRMAGVHEVIEALPDGYRTPLGERGVGLSGGQRQRLAIARALLKRPQILIFDEATANLDGETAQELARTINGLKGHVTLVFIAHQLPRGLELDRIVRLDALAVAGHEAGHSPGGRDAAPAEAFAEPTP